MSLRTGSGQLKNIYGFMRPNITAGVLKGTRFVSQTSPHKNSAMTYDTLNPSAKMGANVKAPSSVAYLKTLSKPELFSLGIIGCLTTSKHLLNFVISLFPYVPMFLIKIFVSRLYCGGDNVQEVRKCGERLQKRGISNMMLSLTIEDSEGTKNIDINHITEETIRSVHEVLKPNLLTQLETAVDVNDVAPGYLALKPSALVANPSQVLLNFKNPEWKEQRDQLVSNCAAITQTVYELNQELLKKYPTRKAPFFVSTIDAEKYDLQNAGVYELQRILFQKFNPVSSPIISCIGTWQLYLTDSAQELEIERQRAEREGYKLGLKLVRGAYIHSEPNRNVIIQPTKEASDINYNTVMTQVIQDLSFNGKNSTYGHLVVASHNYYSQILATEELKGKEYTYAKCNVVLGQLLGMADNVTYDLITNHGAKNIIKYVPWGPPLETKDYLLRRLQENGDAVRADNGWPLVKAIARTVFRA
ncbi:proline dehydrogenase [Zygosaccharomyces mellis]|uniref:Proline dehydrogenase n=1 Tax=Zygosaccharomyces mellis TaxID=42258 RepID=A0A4C2EC06_9SACH|nr:proline dehydrogenase [Zygosaccharomyces mellis]